MHHQDHLLSSETAKQYAQSCQPPLQPRQKLLPVCLLLKWTDHISARWTHLCDVTDDDDLMLITKICEKLLQVLALLHRMDSSMDRVTFT